MASEPIPEPLTNQDLDETHRPEFGASHPLIPDDGEALKAASAPVNPARELMPGKTNRQLNRAAESIGATLGRVVNKARAASDSGDQSGGSWTETAQTKAQYAKQRVAETVQAKAEQAKQKVAETLSDVQERASVGFQETKERVSQTVVDAKRKSSEAMRQAQERARDISDRYPLQVIAGSVAAGVIAGVLLRVWRSSRYE